MNNELSSYQMVIESLNSMLIILLSQKEEFKPKNNATDVIAHINRINKKISNGSYLIKIMSELTFVNEIYKSVKKEDSNVEKLNDNTFIFRHIDQQTYLRSVIANERIRNFDNKTFFDSIYRLPKDFKFFDEGKIEKYIEISENKFTLKMDLLSEDFFDNFITSSVAIERFNKQIFCENYIELGKCDELVMINKIKKKYNFGDIIDFYFGLYTLANFYYSAEKYFFSKERKSSITPILNTNRQSLIVYMSSFFTYYLKKNVKNEVISELVDFYTFGNDAINDLYYQPLLNYHGNILIMPSIIIQNNFGRTFVNHMNKLDIGLRKGDLLEKYIKIMFKEHGFKVYDPDKSQLNFMLSETKKGDIDILALKDRYIFYGQIKNKPSPLDERDFINYDRKLLKVAVKQLKFAKEYLLSNPEKILKYFEIQDIKEFKLIPFILTNSFYRSGEIIDGVSITDMSSMHKLFDDGKISYMNLDGVIFHKKIRQGNFVESIELENHLLNPYFLDVNIYKSLNCVSFCKIKDLNIGLA